MNIRSTLRRATLLAFLLSLLSTALYAGTVMTGKQQSPARGSSEQKIYLDGGRLRVEVTGEAGGERGRVMIYRADTGTLWMLNAADKSYLEMPTGRGPSGRMMRREGAPGGPGAPSKPVFAKTAADVQVNGFTTDKYEGTRDGAKVEEVWAADPKAVAVAAEDLQALKSLAERLGALGGAPGRPPRGGGFALAAPGVPGVPVRIIRYDDGQALSQMDITSIRQEAVPAALFEVPAGYTKREMGPPPGRPN
ncbi:MAG TPA: DUF4412 domain-containing protein [Thermoanaerobaculia bacterium]|nr:DUF4412 domain-containing protein [Thermoanaerobaculia bacterium]